jgi:GTPase Era involved in 16S rRNA processing
MTTPTYAAIGHPNEGKSSVISALTENDTIRISPTPGETVSCATYTLNVNGRDVLNLIDTPGFQNPSAILEWMDAWGGSEADLLPAFLTEHASQPDFHHDRELMSPLTSQTGILYVVDASRPLREVDRQEMEILRRTGLPRLALLNLKSSDRNFLPDWEEALSRRFNLIREFDAHHVSFSGRLDLLDALAELTPQHKEHLQSVKTSLQEEWDHRITEAGLVLETLWLRALRHTTKKTYDPERPEAPQFEEARAEFQEEIRTFERNAHRELRGITQHRSLPPEGPPDSPFSGELFAEKVWRMLGFSRRQLATASALTTAALGASLDLAAGGITFGVFTAAGLVAGGLGGWMGSRKLGERRLPFPGGGSLAKEQIVVGPITNPQLLFILLDRGLLYVQRLLAWSHGRRDNQAFLESLFLKEGLTKTWPDSERSTLIRWIKTHARPGHSKAEETSAAFRELLREKLRKI